MKRLLFLGVAFATAGVGQAIAATPPAPAGRLAKVASVQNVV